MNNVHFHERVSCRIAPTVAAHGMNSNCTTRKLNAAAGIMTVPSVAASVAESSPVPYRMPSVAMEFSLAMNDASSATTSFHERPSCIPIGSSAFPIDPKIDVSILPVGMLASAQITIVITRISDPACFTNPSVRCHTNTPMVRPFGR